MQERVQHEKHNRIYASRYRSDCPLPVNDLVVLMNELVTLEQVQTGTASEEVFDLVEELKTAQDRMETLKYQFQQIAERTGIKKWETDYFTLTYVEETKSVRVDSGRMKDTLIYIVNAQSGELEEVNAYDYFSKKSPVKAHVVYKEKK